MLLGWVFVFACVCVQTNISQACGIELRVSASCIDKGRRRQRGEYCVNIHAWWICAMSLCRLRALRGVLGFG
jgi:hypothetical protein